jgi:hypothetical protein
MGVPGRLLPHTVTIVRPATTTDIYGNTTYDYGAGATRTSMAAWMQQNSRTEPLSNGRDPLVQDWLMITNEADVQGYDRIEWTDQAGNNLTFEVDGPPAPVYTPAGYHHTETTLKVVAG